METRKKTAQNDVPQKKSIWLEILFEALFGAIAFGAITWLRSGIEAVPQYALAGAAAGALIGVGKWLLSRRKEQSQSVQKGGQKRKK